MRKLFNGVFVVLFISCVAVLVVSSGCLSDIDISNLNGNINTNTNASISASTVSIKDIRKNNEAVCRIYADKLILFCKGSKKLTDWHKLAFEDKADFIKLCLADEFFEEADEVDVKELQEDINFAGNCKELLAEF